METLLTKRHLHPGKSSKEGNKVHILNRGVPIIGSAKISATDMVIFTNIGIGIEQQEDGYRYRYLYISNSCT